MANEATLVYAGSNPIDFTVADGTGIEKGALLKLTSPNTAIITSGNQDPIAGIAAAEKVASDGQVKLAVYVDGVWSMTASGSITAGKAVASAGGTAAFVNKVYQAPFTTSGAELVGTALNTTTDNAPVLIMLGPGRTSSNYSP